jgi:hypothetical protein
MRQPDRQTDIPVELESAIKRIAQEQGLRVAFDTHFDARNCVLSWITGRIKYRIDFQPSTSGSSHVTLYQDNYRFQPRLLSWAEHNIPFFAYMSPLFKKIDYQALGDLSNGESRDHYIKVVREYIDGIAHQTVKKAGNRRP